MNDTTSEATSEAGSAAESVETDAVEHSEETRETDQTAEAEESDAPESADEHAVDQAPPLADAGREWLVELFDRMNLDVEVEALEEEERVHFDVSGPDAGRLLGAGKLGPKAIEGVETVLQCSFSEHPDERELYVDIGGAREDRKQTLQRVADQMADRALDLGETLTVSGLNSTDRRIIHRQLRDNDAVDTESVGDGIFRRLRILPESK
ncbi:MAG: protein jag [Bradymonadaceae bacterium]